MEMQGLSAICAGLGFAEEDENGNRIGYAKGDQCLENIKDLLRFLRRDNPQTREVFKQVCKWSTVSKDLIPIIQFCQDDRNLALNAVKVLVFLTMPIEPSSSDIPQQIDYLWGLKSAITNSDTVAVVVSLLEGPLENLASERFTEDDWKLVQLVMTLFRNILAVQDISTLQKIGGSASQFLMLRDRFLELLFQENVMDLIMVMTQHLGGPSGYLRQDNLLLLEIFHYIFAGQDPELIAKARGKDRKVGGDTKASLNCLKSIMEEEEGKRKFSRQQNMSRHSQLGGTFTRITMDGSKAVYKGKPSSSSRNILLQKVQKAPGKKIVWDHGRLPAMKDNILVLLHDFMNQFLLGGYNALMQSIREDIEKEHHAIQSSDVAVFFQVAQFATSFQYHKFLTYEPTAEKDTSCAFTDEHADSTYFKGDICGPIAASMNESMFLLLVSRWRFAFDGLKETNNYKFLSAAGSLMKIMIRLLDLVLKILPEDSKEPQTARILLYKLFYDQTDEGMSQFLLSLIKSFDLHKQPKSDLADLVEMIHVIVRLMEKLQSRGTLRVSKKSRKVRKNTADDKDTGNELAGNEAAGHDPTVHSGSEHLIVLEKQGKEDASSGHQETMNVAAEADETEIPMPDMMSFDGNLHPMDERKTDHINNNLCCSSDDSSNDEQPPATTEVDFRVSTFVSTFANHSIIRNLCWLLRFYKSNSVRTNNYIIGMLRRITDDLDLSPMLYQLSLITIFYEILNEQKSCPGTEYSNIVDFLTRLVRRMLRKMKTQPLLFVEILFWKSRRECHYINAEHLLHELGNMRKESRLWGNDSENGEFGSSQTTGWVPRSIADALGEDEADVVISHGLGPKEVEENIGEVEKDVTSISNRDEGKENFDHGGHTMGLENERVSRRKRRLVLTEELEIKIKDLYNKFKDSENCSQLLAEYLDPDGRISAAQVLNKLKHLGLKVASKKRKHHSDRPSSTEPLQPREKARIMEKETEISNAVDLEKSSQKQSLSTRKRIHAFSKDQEEKIKALYEKFRDNKKCSNIIANALAPDNSFTAAQVSRKLKQLGLHVPRRKKSKADVVDGPSVNGPDSDDETLLSLRNRTKKKDDDRLFNDSLKQTIEEESSGGSDDELLSSILRDEKKDSAKLFCNGQNKETQVLDLEDSDNKLSSAILQDLRGSQPTGMDVEGIYEDTTLNDLRKDEEFSADDSLADSDDDHVLSATFPKSADVKRKLRMVIDPETDDDDDHKSLGVVES